MWKNQTPPPLVKVVYIWNVDYFDFGFDPYPHLWTFSIICDIFCLESSSNLVLPTNVTNPNQPNQTQSSYIENQILNLLLRLWEIKSWS